MRVLLTVAVLAVLSLSTAMASTKEHQQVKFDLAKFTEQREAVESAIARSEVYREIGEERAKQVKDSLSAMGELLQNASSLGELTADQRAELFNHQELINNVLTRAAEDSRMICTRETPTGSHMQRSYCSTLAQRRKAAEAAKESMRNMQRSWLPLEG